jgi:hypothetical protein
MFVLFSDVPPVGEQWLATARPDAVVRSAIPCSELAGVLHAMLSLSAARGWEHAQHNILAR